MVIYTRAEDLKWTKIDPMGIEIAALAHSRPYPHRDWISFDYGINLSSELGLSLMPHRLMYELIKEYPGLVNDFFDPLGNNHGWMTSTLAFYSRKQSKSGPRLKLETYSGCRYEMPPELFKKVCFVEYPNYRLERKDGGIEIIIPDLDDIIAMEFDYVSYSDHKADPDTKLPVFEEGSDIRMIHPERKAMGILSAMHEPYRAGEPYTCMISQGSNGLLVHREL